MTEGSAPPIVIVAACVLVRTDGHILLARRPAGRALAGLWEFPGGKVEKNEEPEAALIRELKEELGIDIARADLKPLTFVSHAYADFHLLMPLYLSERWQGDAAGLEGQELAWARPNGLHDYAMPPADEPLKFTLPGLLEREIE